ncbi:MAG TPA: hypothetical protein VLL95_03435 [Phnomibacter sp.]|jgi:hypothetical protein|nr:hypothetical protein [Phnomibacter sp.]
MKKLLFVAVIGALVACGESNTEATTTDTPVVEAPAVDTTAAAVDTTAAVADTTAKADSTAK